MRILYLLNTLQHPTMRGSLRHYHLLTRLSRRHEVTLLALAKEGGGEVTPEAVREIGGMVERLETFEATGPDRFSRARESGLVRRIAGRARRTLGIRAAVRRMEKTASDLRRRASFDVALCHGKELYPLISRLEEPPVLMDACDATPLRRRALLRGAGAADLPWRLLRYARSVWVENRLVRRADRRTYISPRDRDAVPAANGDARVVPNGIDLDYWRRGGRTGESDCLVFTGVMDYPPNVDAAKWLAREILPRVRRVRPDAELLVAGRDPAPDLRRLDEASPDITVTGYVEDMRPWLARGTVFAAGLRSASGQQNKVLEAMAMEVPVVATPAAAEGFRLEGAGAPPMRVAADADEFAGGVVELLDDGDARSTLARRGRDFVEKHFDWDRSAAALEEECRAAAGRPQSRPSGDGAPRSDGDSGSPEGAAPGGDGPDRSLPFPRRALDRLKRAARLEGESWSLTEGGAAVLALLPLLLVAVTGAAALDGKAAYKAIIREDGIAEILQVLAWVGAAGLALLAGRRLRREGASWEAWLYGLVGVLALFVVGEEISWGQRIFGWTTPDQVADVNRQGETNLHNVHAVEGLFQWGKILAGAYGCLLPFLARPLDPVRRLMHQWASPMPGPGATGSAESPGRSAASLLVPPQFLVPLFAFPFVWGLYRMFAPRPPVYEWAIAEFGEVVELQLALGVLLFLFLVHRRLRSGAGAPGADGAQVTGTPASAVRPAQEAEASPTPPQILQALDGAGIRYVLLRGWQQATDEREEPEPRPGSGDREIDLLVPREDLPALARELGSRGFTTLPAAGHEPHTFFVRYDQSRDGWLKLDVVTDLLYGRSSFTLRGGQDPDDVLRKRRRRANLWRPRRDDEFVALLSHCLLDEGRVAVRHRKRLASLLREIREAAGEERLARRVGELLGPVGSWEDVERAIDAGAWSEIERLGPPLGRRLLMADLPGTVWRSLRSRTLGLLRPLMSLLRRTGFSVTLLGPDGAGKTTLAREIARRSPIPSRVVYMGMNRSANTVRLPGGDPLVRGAGRLRRSSWPPVRWIGRGLGFGVRVGEQLLRSAAARLRRAMGHLVVFDRFTYDSRRSGEPTSLKGRTRRRLLEAPVPTPDLVIVLDAPAEVLRSRQDEHPVGELQRQREEYLNLAERLPPPAAVVDADRNPGDVCREVLSLLWRRIGGARPTTGTESTEGTTRRRTAAPAAE